MDRFVLKSLLFIVSFTVSVTTAGAESFLIDKQKSRKTEEDFTRRMTILGEGKGSTFLRFEREADMSDTERDAFRFLAACCPLCDIADCEPDYFLRQVRGAFRAREYFSWGAGVPEDVFIHFVLPHRVNNENLDEARDLFFEEIKDRISGLSMYEAALEVNHWCHEKVEYRATDARTSAPLALVKTSWGRCGEESAFTATALRAVGIPARQVYTPRWVHTDSNHAWVEVWIDGRWYYLGACEPEPELDMAWFTTPATRAMMMHTTVFGPYNGPEEVNVSTPYYTTINLLASYAPVRELKVRVTDSAGNPVPDASVKFKVYNYSEFYPIVTRSTDKDGFSSVTTGYGDILVWASKGDDYGYAKAGPDLNEVKIVMGRVPGAVYSETFTMEVPAAQPAAVAEHEKAAENRRRLAREDSIRNAYMATFAGNREVPLSLNAQLSADTVMYFLRTAQGNWPDVADFIRKAGDNPFLLPYLASLSAKDLRDTPGEYLAAHLDPITIPAYEVPDSMVASKILSPRIDMEIISDWRQELRELQFNDPVKIVDYVRNGIRVADSQNYVACSITPSGVLRTGMADRRSRNVFFVALCRSSGIPAHIDRATGKPQFWKDRVWHDALLDGDVAITSVPPMGRVVFDADKSNPVEPVYRSHYTVARFEEGDFRTLDITGDLAGRGYPASVEVPAGYYRFMAGSRANDGSVTVHTEYFNIAEGEQKDIVVSLPALTDKLFVQGTLDMNTIIFLPDGTKTTLKEQSNDKGLVLIFVDPATEPTRHILQEMPSFTARLEEWGGGVLLVEPDDVGGVSYNTSLFGTLPSQSIWMADSGRSLLREAASALRTDFVNEYPLTLYLNTSGGILFSHKGYRLGLVESLWKTITAERETLQ